MALALLALLALVALVFVLPRLIGAGVGAAVGSGINKASGSYAARRRLRAAFTTALNAPDIMAATTDAAAMLSDAQATFDSVASAAVVTFASGGSVSVHIAADRAGGTRVQMVPSGSARDDTLARFRSSMLAALRQRDPNTRQH